MLVAAAGAVCVLAGVLVLGDRPPAEIGELTTAASGPAAPFGLDGTAAPVAPGVPLVPGVPAAGRTTASGSVPSGAAADGVVPSTLSIRGADVPVVPVVTASDGSLTLPERPTTVGWWSPGALPGSAAGSVVLAGHVDSRTAGLGAFAVLRRLAVGEQVTVRGADGREVGYRVVARREYGKAALPADLFARDGAPRLVMITCGGRFDPAARSYDDNVVVYAAPVGGPAGTV